MSFLKLTSKWEFENSNFDTENEEDLEKASMTTMISQSIAQKAFIKASQILDVECDCEPIQGIFSANTKR